ncbi:class I adenylate-forming enzyme family protein [Umezawaea sp. Da 62-37]|uniref:class I adenylate-forming enzyme family protein n=1 Tax=Umezawaea sp. Da 62-37 TaxID=3075927 RepID=UPI0028F716EA|nr:class I adenylate-forming enzyme family protein [Umezawaea sp. Da 62-37]WNV86959.1 class I adenylate-forming enzyme family protein [Umezawaea sp. Da 62-37]
MGVLIEDLITDLLAKGADDAPFATHQRTLTRGGLRAAVAAEAEAFAASGVRPGSTVALQVPSSFSQFEALLALWTLGAQVMVVDPRLAPVELEAVRERCRPQFVVRAESGGRKPLPFAERYELLTERRSDGRAATTDHRLVQFSSGSTGLPKVIGRTADSLCAEIDVFNALPDLPGAGEKVLLLSSSVHSFGLVFGLLRSLDVGVHLVFSAQRSGRDMIGMAASHGVVMITGMPVHYDAMARVEDPPPLPALRCVLAGGELIKPEVEQAFAARYGLPVGQGYGSTETGILTMDVTGGTRPAVGRVCEGVRLRVRDGQVEVGLDRSPYLSEPEQVRYEDGWWRTGDRGELRADGSLTLMGRADSLVILGGYKVDLLEIEDALRLHPLVNEAIVVHDDAVEAYVATSSDDLDETAVAAWCGEQLADFKQPAAFRVLRALPRTPNGKLVRDRSVLAGH